LEGSAGVGRAVGALHAPIRCAWIRRRQAPPAEGRKGDSGGGGQLRIVAVRLGQGGGGVGGGAGAGKGSEATGAMPGRSAPPMLVGGQRRCRVGVGASEALVGALGVGGERTGFG